MEAKALRELAGLTQFSAAHLAGIPRMRLSLAETGQVELSPEEAAALRRVYRAALLKRAAQVQAILSRQEFSEARA